ncbi:MAG TPA: multicopper oxidase domain-containing protein [Nocardioidaceae bacterium]|nr:multicopper oxidase domain-containing protein [Nocardioidaceae bacterium]
MTRRTRPLRGFQPLRDLPAVLWLMLLVPVALAHGVIPAPRWLMFHLLLLGAVTHSILVWSKHFADTLLHAAPRPHDARHQSIRLGLLNLGVLLVLVGVPADVWPLTVAGAAGLTTAVVWHGVSLAGRMRRSLPSRFGPTVRYYVAAASLLPIGAGLGVTLARGMDETWHPRLMLAHVAVNVLGWMGLTVVGTLVTLWPTMLRTRLVEGTERAARQALPVLLGSVLVTATAALVGILPLVALGLAGYLAGLAMTGRFVYLAARGKPPASFPTFSVLAGLVWLAGTVAGLALAVGTAGTFDAAHERLEWLTPALAAGFGAQVLLGALSYLVPVALGGGPSPVRAANTALDRGGPLRIVVVNGALVVGLLPVPDLVRQLCWALVIAGLAAFIPLLFAGMKASRRAKQAPPEPVPADRRGPASPTAPRPRGQVAGLAAVGLGAVVLAVAAGVAVNPSALAGKLGAVTPTGHTTTVHVQAADMHFTPSTVHVPVGNRLVIDVTNVDQGNVHDLVLDNGADSGLLTPGQSARVDVGVVGHDLDGWCAVGAHRDMGMVFHVTVTGTSGGHQMAGMPGMSRAGHRPSAASLLDFSRAPGPGFRPHDATLPPLEPGRVHRRTFTVSEVERAVAPGDGQSVKQRLWTYDGTAPGPTLHGRIGDTFVITLVNDGSMGHSVDFHAGTLAPDGPMRTIAPGQSLTYRFTATRAGIWLYHCSSMPMSAHIANGMFGAVVIDPPNLPPVAHSYVIVQSELYLGPQGGTVDLAKLRAEKPDAVVFNGYADQYDDAPLQAKVGQRVRIWVLDAGPDRPTSFHVVGGQFDTVYVEGAYRLRRGSPGGSQALFLGPAQGGFVELTFPQPGHYPFVSHVMTDAERGAHGVFEVTR